MCVVEVLCCLDRCFKKKKEKKKGDDGERKTLKQMDFRIVFFELLLLLFLEDKCNYVE